MTTDLYKELRKKEATEQLLLYHSDHRALCLSCYRKKSVLAFTFHLSFYLAFIGGNIQKTLTQLLPTWRHGFQTHKFKVRVHHRHGEVQAIIVG